MGRLHRITSTDYFQVQQLLTDAADLIGGCLDGQRVTYGDVLAAVEKIVGAQIALAEGINPQGGTGQ